MSDLNITASNLHSPAALKLLSELLSSQLDHNSADPSVCAANQQAVQALSTLANAIDAQQAAEDDD